LLKNALADSPTNSQNAQVACWLGEAYAHLNDPTQALRFFDQLTQKNITPFTVQAALSASQVLQKQGDWNIALKNSRKAMAVAHQTEQQMEALYGIAKSYFALSLFDSSAQATRQLIEAGQFRNPYYNKAILLNAQLFLAANLDPQAKGRNVFTHLEELIQNTGITSESTEALYLTAELKAKQGNWEACANILYQLFTTCPHYTYWNERAWLLLADAFVGMENPLQARAALLHLNITSQNTEILESAREKLIELDAQTIP
jgi:tetratricopeptide (TPR) repeat protein